MGKAEEEQPLPSGVVSGDPEQNVETNCVYRCSRIRKFISLRCIFVLLLSTALFLSALFWLPPFLRYADQEDLHSDSKYKGHDIVASFIVKKPVSVLQDNILQLADDIFGEIVLPSTKVVILSLDPLSGSNMTKVEFAVDPDDKYSRMSSATASLIRSSFESLVIQSSILQLTPSLFGNPFSFEVLRFKGGITIVPQQRAFLLQKAQTLFNFTLNFSIDEIQSNFDELTSQLKSGLHLQSYENLYVSLSNTYGSTVAAPTILQSSVVLAVGNPTRERLKQLAETITGSHSRNLGLNNTQFGRVKQVRLSSILQHSLNGSDGSGTAQSPSPVPLPHPHHHHHHHLHRGHHHHHHNAHLAPDASPTPAPRIGNGATPPEIGSPAAAKNVPPARGRNSHAEPPNCQFERRKRSSSKAGKHSHPPVAVAPSIATHYPAASPKKQVPPHVYHSVPSSSPLPNVAYAHAEPPPKTEPAAERSGTHSYGPSPSPSSAGTLGTMKWTTLIVVVLCVTSITKV